MVLLPAKGAKVFYDSKSWIVNVAGDPQFLINNGFKSKVNPIESLTVPYLLTSIPTEANCQRIARDLTEQGYGKKFIDALTENGTSDTYLKKLALWNANKQDIEFGAENLRADNPDALETLLADDYEPILQNNFIVLTHTACTTNKNGKQTCVTYYAIFHVDVTKEEAFDIVAHIGDPLYKDMKFPVSYVYSGTYSEDDTEAQIAKHVPALAVRGVLLRRHPARISIGENAGIQKGDLVSIYSQRSDKDGNQYSKRISRARVCGVWGDEAQVNFEAGTAGNRKNGDVVVRTPDSHYRWGIKATYMPHVWGGEIFMDGKSGFTRSGIIHHMLLGLGFSMTDHPGDKYVVLDRNGEFQAPMFANIGLGYGIGKTFLGFMDVMPFFMVQYEAGFMLSKFSDLLDEDETKGSAPFASSVRIPIGLRLSFNLSYPCKIFVEGGYAARLGFGDDDKIIKQACEYQGAKRSGVFVNLGFIF